MKKFLLSFAAMFVAILFVLAEVEGAGSIVTPGANAEANYTVNDSAAVKAGTSDAKGIININVPANTACVTFSAGALKGSGDVTITVTNSATQEIVATIDVPSYEEFEDGQKDYVIEGGNITYALPFDAPIAEATTLSLTAEKPFVVWNVVADPNAPYASKVTDDDFSAVKFTFPAAESIKIEELGMALLYNGDEMIGEANDKSIIVEGNTITVPFTIFASDSDSEAKPRNRKSFYEHETFSGYHLYMYGGDLIIDGENTEEDLYVAIPVEVKEEPEASEYTVGQEVTVGDAIYTVKSENLFVNGSFTKGVKGWKAVDYATDAVASNFAVSATGGYDEGAYITTSAEGAKSEKTIRQSIAVEEGKTYLFAVYTSGKAPEASNHQYNALFQMTDALTENGALKAFNWGDAESTTWTKTEYVFTAQEGNPFVGVRMGWNANSSFDGFSLVEVEKTGDVDPGDGKPQAAKIETGDYYIYNIKAKAWLGGANSWGTQASLVDHAQMFTVTAKEDGTYSIDSHTYNNANNHYFADGLYVDSPEFGWTIYTVENGVALAAGENKYVASAEGSTILGTVEDINDAAAVWKLYSSEDMLAALNNGETKDATFLIKGAAISRNLYNASFEAAWEGDKFSVGGANENQNAEKWGGNSQEFDVYQNITLPNGTYKITVNGYYRYNNTTENTNEVAITAHADGTEEINTYLYANDAEVALKSIADDEATAALEAIPFSQSDASAAFGKGLYLNELVVKVTDGTLKLGIKKTQHPGCDWSVWDNFTLTVVNDEPEEVIPAADPEPAANEGYHWSETLVNNGDFTKEDLSSFPVQGTGVTGTIIDGPNGTKVYEIQSADKQSQTWDSQVFIKSNEVLNEGDYYLVSFSYKAEAASTPETQAHATPGNYLHWQMLNPNPSFTTEWQTTTWTGTISAAQAKGNEGKGSGTGMTTIAFNLNVNEKACKYYITNVVVKKQIKDVIDGISSTKASSKANGKYIENGKIVIVKNGVKYNVAGAIIK